LQNEKELQDNYITGLNMQKQKIRGSANDHSANDVYKSTLQSVTRHPLKRRYVKFFAI